MKTNRLLLVLTFLSALLFGTTLYAQQEVDPTWYNPWAASNNATAQRAQTARHRSRPRNRAKIAASSRQQHVAKLRVKRVVTRPAQS